MTEPVLKAISPEELRRLTGILSSKPMEDKARAVLQAQAPDTEFLHGFMRGLAFACALVVGERSGENSYTELCTYLYVSAERLLANKR